MAQLTLITSFFIPLDPTNMRSDSSVCGISPVPVQSVIRVPCASRHRPRLRNAYVLAHGVVLPESEETIAHWAYGLRTVYFPVFAHVAVFRIDNDPFEYRFGWHRDTRRMCGLD